MKSSTNIMIVGVGGQGTLLASRILGHLFMNSGFDVKISEVHGMSQRGGSVVTYVKYGEKVYSPTVEQGEADFILAFEGLEAARALSCLSKEGRLIANTQRIDPMPVITGAAQYPRKIMENIQEQGCHLHAFDALSLAEEAGSSKAVNIVLIGYLSNFLPFAVEQWEESIMHCVKPQFVEMNEKAFRLGRDKGAQEIHKGGNQG